MEKGGEYVAKIPVPVKKDIKSSSRNTSATTSQQAPKKTFGQRLKGLFKVLAIIVLIVALLIGGFFGGVYLKFFNAQSVVNTLHLQKAPFIGHYFSADNKKGADDGKSDADDGKEQADKKEEKVDVGSVDKSAAMLPNPQQVAATQQKMAQERQAEQAIVMKRIGNLAKLYAQMDPQKAANAMAQINNNVVANILQKMDASASAQIMDAFPPAKAAAVTQTMYNGPVPPTLPELSNAESAMANAGGTSGGNTGSNALQ